MTALGLRINNPLNLMYRPQDDWEGLADPPFVATGECSFVDVPHAIRACTIQLQHYLARGINTVPKIIKLWSTTDQAAYTVDVLRWGHFLAAQVLAIDDALALFKAMCRQEDGSDPYPDSVIQQGINMALGIDSPAQTATAAATVTALAPPMNALQAHVSRNAQAYGGSASGLSAAGVIALELHQRFHFDLSQVEIGILGFVLTVLCAQLFPKGLPLSGPNQ
jgi:hypothetical protein